MGNHILAIEPTSSISYTGPSAQSFHHLFGLGQSAAVQLPSNINTGDGFAALSQLPQAQLLLFTAKPLHVGEILHEGNRITNRCIRT